MSSNLTEVKAQLSELDMRLDATDGKIREARQTLTTYMLLMNKLNLPYGIDEAIQKLIRLKMVVDTLIRAVVVLEAATTPWGMLRGAGLLGVAAVSGYSLITYTATTGV